MRKDAEIFVYVIPFYNSDPTHLLEMSLFVATQCINICDTDTHTHKHFHENEKHRRVHLTKQLT